MDVALLRLLFRLCRKLWAKLLLVVRRRRLVLVGRLIEVLESCDLVILGFSRVEDEHGI